MNDLTAAIRQALADYLSAGLAPLFPGIDVSGVWPTAGKAKQPTAVTVLASDAPDIEYHPPVIYRVTPGTYPSGTADYSYGWIDLPLQIDAWASFKAVRDLLAGALRELLNRHPADSLNLPGQWPHIGTHPGLVLLVPDLLNAPCDYHFTAAGQVPEDSDPAQTSTWRSMWAGNARMQIVGSQLVPLIKKLQLQFSIDGANSAETITSP